MYTSSNLYTHLVNGKQVDIFEDAEPYFYGTAAPSTVYFKPLGGADPDYRIQQLTKESSNTFSKIVAVDKFVFKGESDIKPLEYIKKGSIQFACWMPTINANGTYCKTLILMRMSV